MSPVSTGRSSSTLPSSATTRTVPFAGTSKVLSCEPYSSAFCAINPTLGTEPIVGIDHGEARSFRVLGLDVSLDRFFFSCRQRLDLRQQIAEAVVEIDAKTFQRGGVLLDHIGE